MLIICRRRSERAGPHDESVALWHLQFPHTATSTILTNTNVHHRLCPLGSNWLRTFPHCSCLTLPHTPHQPIATGRFIAYWRKTPKPVNLRLLHILKSASQYSTSSNPSLKYSEWQPGNEISQTGIPSLSAIDKQCRKSFVPIPWLWYWESTTKVEISDCVVSECLRGNGITYNNVYLFPSAFS